ncbi:MAG: hypothetical protein WAO55_06370 [Candidatus Manganitrophaceae bacterium]
MAGGTVTSLGHWLQIAGEIVDQAYQTDPAPCRPRPVPDRLSALPPDTALSQLPVRTRDPVWHCLGGSGFQELRKMVEEAAMPRLYGGIHFSSDNNNGLVLGREIGRRVVDYAR